MKRYLIFDTETTGFLPDCHIVQLGAILTDDTGHDLATLDMIVRPEGWKIPESSQAIHGISTEKAEKEGILLPKVLEMFFVLVSMSDLIVCHNVNFDKNVILNEVSRPENIKTFCRSGEYFENSDFFCTMINTVYFCRLPGKYDKFKWPKLEELYEILFENKMINAHNAFADVQATKRCFFELKRKGLVAI